MFVVQVWVLSADFFLLGKMFVPKYLEVALNKTKPSPTRVGELIKMQGNGSRFR